MTFSTYPYSCLWTEVRVESYLRMPASSHGRYLGSSPIGHRERGKSARRSSNDPEDQRQYTRGGRNRKPVPHHLRAYGDTRVQERAAVAHFLVQFSYAICGKHPRLHKMPT